MKGGEREREKEKNVVLCGAKRRKTREKKTPRMAIKDGIVMLNEVCDNAISKWIDSPAGQCAEYEYAQ